MAEVIEIILLVFIAAFLVMQSKDGLRVFMGKRQRKIILDSCALIDGRVAEIVRSGFVSDELVIPQFVLNELQLLADGHDGHKRERARFGLDVAHELQDSTFGATVTIDRTQFPEVPATDDKLIALAKKVEGFLYTTDYNLAKVAAIERVSVLNVNELAQALRPVALPGESLNIKITQKGSNPNQGVGYLEDGTMIVIEGAARYVGHIVEVVVTRMHQTVAGKMVFGQIKEQPKAQPRQHENAAARQVQQAMKSTAPAGQPQSQQRRSQQQASAASSAQTQAESKQRSKIHSRLLGNKNQDQQSGAGRPRRRIHG